MSSIYVVASLVGTIWHIVKAGDATYTGGSVFCIRTGSAGGIGDEREDKGCTCRADI